MLTKHEHMCTSTATHMAQHAHAGSVLGPVPDLVISFGTAGGVVGQAEIGDALLANGCVYIDRLRTSSKTAFDWGVHGGPVLPAHRAEAPLPAIQQG